MRSTSILLSPLPHGPRQADDLDPPGSRPAERRRARRRGRSRRVDVVDEAHARRGPAPRAANARGDVPAPLRPRQVALTRDARPAPQQGSHGDRPGSGELRRRAPPPGRDPAQARGRGLRGRTRSRPRSGCGRAATTSVGRDGRRGRAGRAPSTTPRTPARRPRRRSPARALANASRRPLHSAQRRTGHGPGAPQRSHQGGAQRTSRARQRAHTDPPTRPQMPHRRGKTRSRSCTRPTVGPDRVPDRAGFVPESVPVIRDSARTGMRSSRLRAWASVREHLPQERLRPPRDPPAP